jgi:multiple sugar transport system ATP-binding protein
VLYTTHDYREALALGDMVAVIREGVVEQVGHPDEIFHQPSNQFVGAFVGQPPMNFVDMAVKALGDGLVLEAGALRVPLPVSYHEAARAGRVPERVRVGIRPRSVRLGEDGPVMRVVVSEPVGRETVLTFEHSGLRIRAVSAERPRPQRGDRLPVSLSVDHAVLFDEKGERLVGLSTV